MRRKLRTPLVAQSVVYVSCATQRATDVMAKKGKIRLFYKWKPIHIDNVKYLIFQRTFQRHPDKVETVGVK